MRILAMTVFTAALCAGQPRFPQHSTGMPSVQMPAIGNQHITNLGATIAGRPIAPGTPVVGPGTRGPRIISAPAPGGAVYPRGFYGRPAYVGGGGFYGGGWYPYPMVTPAPQPVVVIQQPAPAPQPILVMNPDYKPETPKPVMQEFSNIRNPYENFEPTGPKVFLLAVKDGSLRQAVAYWVEKDELHFVQPDHKQDKIPWSRFDRESTIRFNKERGLDVHLPNP